MQLQLPQGLETLFSGRLALAVELAIQAGHHTLSYFQTGGFSVERKQDDSPVTIADKEAEQLIRAILAERFPQDAILGEEFGEQAGDSEYQWIVDPIDGTKSFICGVPLYSTLVGVTRNRETLIGVINIPALDEIVFAARDHGAWYRTRINRTPPESSYSYSEWARARVSSRPSLNNGLFVVSQVDNFAKQDVGEAYLALERLAYVTRSWGDGYGYLLVATGRAEAMVDPIVNPWDAAAVAPVVEEAGGRCTSWSGKSTIYEGNLVGTNGLVHEEVMVALQMSRSE